MSYLFQCMNPDCSPDEINGWVFESKLPICPKCKERPPIVATVVLIHLAYHNKQGSIRGYRGKRSSVACQTVNFCDQFNAVTSYLPLVNCPKCRQTDIYKNNWRPNFDDPNSFFSDPNMTDEEKLKIIEGEK